MLADTTGHSMAIDIKHIDQMIVRIPGVDYLLGLVEFRQFPGLRVPLQFCHKPIKFLWIILADDTSGDWDLRAK